MSQIRYNCFDLLRFLFAFIVFIGHFVEISALPDIQFLAPFFNTYFSITGFFIISGFLVTQSYMRSTLSDYLKKRAKRLLPAYIFVILACACFLVFLSSYSFADYFSNPLWIKYLFANLSFLNFIQPCLPGVFETGFADCSVNGALWTLKVEVMFYLCLPLLIWLYRKVKCKKLFLIAVYFLSVLYRNGLGYMAVLTDDHIYTILARQLPGFLSYFVGGMGLFLFFEDFLKYKNRLILPALVIFVSEFWFNIEILRPIAFAIIVLFVAYSCPALNHFGKYGDISYGVYIYHCPIIKALGTLGLYTALPTAWVFVVIVLIVVLFGFASWHLMEKRFLKRAKQLVQ